MQNIKIRLHVVFFYNLKNLGIEKLSDILYNINMEVYRYLDQYELNSILSRRTSDLGVEYGNYRNIRNNTHKYKSGIRYLHFFKNKDSMLMTSYLYRNLKGNYYFCTFDIPYRYLVFHGGEGYYPASGYDNRTVLKEYAISAEHFDPSWLKEYQLDTQRVEISFKDVEHLSR